MARRIKYPTQCYYCKRLIQPPNGCLQRTNGKWFCHCDDCRNKKNQNVTLSFGPDGNIPDEDNTNKSEYAN